MLSIHLVYGGGDSSTEGETRLRRGRLDYGGVTLLQRARLVNGGEDSSMEGETHVFSPVKSCPFMYPLVQNR